MRTLESSGAGGPGGDAAFVRLLLMLHGAGLVPAAACAADMLTISAQVAVARAVADRDTLAAEVRTVNLLSAAAGSARLPPPASSRELKPGLLMALLHREGTHWQLKPGLLMALLHREGTHAASSPHADDAIAAATATAAARSSCRAVLDGDASAQSKHALSTSRLSCARMSCAPACCSRPRAAARSLVEGRQMSLRAFARRGPGGR